MKDETILLRINPETKEKVRKICSKERRSMTSLILLLIDEKIRRTDNGKGE